MSYDSARAKKLQGGESNAPPPSLFRLGLRNINIFFPEIADNKYGKAELSLEYFEFMYNYMYTIQFIQ